MRKPTRSEALLAAGLAGAAAVNARWNAKRADVASKARRAQSESGRAVEVLGADGGYRYVRVHGADNLPTLVLVHGWVETSELWHRQIEGLADEFRIVAYDHRGHGLSDPPATTTTRWMPWRQIFSSSSRQRPSKAASCPSSPATRWAP